MLPWNMFQLEQKAKTDMSIFSQVSPFHNTSICISLIYMIDPRTRVALYLQQGISNSDYINANFIRVSNALYANSILYNKL